jgi:hypothetical protein
MPTLPQITLTAQLQDVTGSAAGTATSPAVLRIALAGFGLTLPCIQGTSNLVQVGPEDFYDTGTGLSIKLWGNDQIFPSGTYYAITLLDGDGNILQCGAYRFTGAQTIDLSNAPQIYPTPPTTPPGIPVLTNPPGAALQTIDGSITIDGNLIVTGTINGGGLVIVPIVAGVAEFDGTHGNSQSLTLTEDVTSTAANFVPGSTIMTLVKQDATGGWTMSWPANFINTPEINPAPLGATSQIWMLDEAANYYPFGAATWS